MVSLNSALSTFANSSIGRDLSAAIPTAIALGLAGTNPVASTAVGAAIAGASTSFISDLGKQLAGGVGSAVASAEHGVSAVVSGVEDAVTSVAAPVVHGLGMLINVMA